MIRVFPRRTKWTPDDDLTFVGDPPLWIEDVLVRTAEVHVSVTFTWDRAEGERLARAWGRFYPEIHLGGPAYGDPGGEFEPGRYVKKGVVVTSRGCPRHCGFCLVPGREGKIRELEIKDGWNVFDNNLLACSRPHVEAVFEMLRRQKERVSFSGGLDAQLLQPWHVELLKSVSIKRMWFAADSWQGVLRLERARDLLADFHREQRYCYVLVGFHGEPIHEAERRLRRVYSLGFMPFAMLYRGTEVDKRIHDDPAWRSLVRTWCNPARYKAVMRGREI